MNAALGDGALGVALACVVSVTSGCGPAAADSPCARMGQEVMPDDVVQGTRVGDILEPYFGTYSGSLRLGDGESTALTISVPYEPGEPYRLSNVMECHANNIYCYVTTHVATGDGVFDHDIGATISDKFPEAQSGALPQSVLSYSGLGVRQWGEKLTARLPVDPSRYDSPSLHFELDWPSKSSPLGGQVVFNGALRGTELRDRLVVASLSFEAP